MIQFIDLKKQWSLHEKSIRARMDAVLAHGKYIMGPEVAELESVLAEFAGAGHCVGCASGTDALLMALMAIGAGPGDAVFTTPFTFIATSEVVSLLGATPVFVDVDPLTLNIDPEALDRAASAVAGNSSKDHPLPKTERPLTPKAVIPVDLFGIPADYDALDAVASKHGLAVIEDAAQSFGAGYKGRKACSLSPLAATSFFPAKPLGCFGDGGAVFAKDAQTAAVLKSIRVHGQGSDKYDNVRIGLNARLDTLQAAVLLAKMEFFPSELESRQRVAGWYTQALAGVVETPAVPAGVKSAWAQYSIRHPRRDEIIAGLRDKGIPAMIYYPRPLHLLGAYEHLAYREGDFPVCETASKVILSLPMHPYLTEEDASFIARSVKDVLAG
ncbi:MAG: DegT/DnrJ/EryC1/StrS family aminotransferase [Thermodesulfobacteriota bacterium]